MRPTPDIDEQMSGSAYTYKAIAYAYPTSYLANRYNKGNGFFYVEIYSPVSICPAFGEKALRFPANRFETCEDAEKAAEKFPCKWSPYYLQKPLHGSRLPRYTVHLGRTSATFATLEEATALCSEVFEKSGIVLSITNA